MKKTIKVLFVCFAILISYSSCFAAISNAEKKQQIIALYNTNKLDEAYTMISSMTEDERDYELWYILGNISQDYGNEENAIFFLQKATILKPEFDKAHYNLGNIYLKENKYNSAINEYKLAIKYKKDFPYSYYNMGCAYLGQKQYRDAKNTFLNAIKLNGNEPDFYYNLALSYKNLGEKEKAQKYLDIYNKMKEI